jgi:selenocysteine lyase/cysteine desulfurase
MHTTEAVQQVRALLRGQMPVSRKWAYFDHAAVAPIPRAAAEAMRVWNDQALLEGDTAWGQWSRRIEVVRQRAASLVNAREDEIALVPNTTAGVNIVAEGLDWIAGDNVVIAANEFPTNQYPWLNLQSRGVQVRRVEPKGIAIDANRIAAACDARTRIVSLSWVGYATGWRIDPAEFAQVAHDRGALFFLDAIQGLGVFPLNVQAARVDFFAADGHKWLLGPEGAGVFYVKRELLEALRPIGVGWHSVAHASDYRRIETAWRPAAARYEGGSQNMVGFHGLGASLDLLAACGLSPSASPLAESVLDFTSQAMARLDDFGAKVVSPRDAAHRSGIVSFEMPGCDPQQLRVSCLQRGVVFACRDGRLRISPHAYNDASDLDRLIAALQAA